MRDPRPEMICSFWNTLTDLWSSLGAQHLSLDETNSLKVALEGQELSQDNINREINGARLATVIDARSGAEPALALYFHWGRRGSGSMGVHLHPLFSVYAMHDSHRVEGQARKGESCAYYYFVGLKPDRVYTIHFEGENIR